MQAELLVSVGNAGIWLDEHIRHLESHDILPVARAANDATYETDFGRIYLLAQDGALQVRIESPDEAALTTLQGSITHYLAETDPVLAKTITWSGVAPAPGQPKNFRKMTVAQVQPLSSWLLRMTLKGEDLAPFDQRGLHVRLMFPEVPGDRETVWPTIEPSGAVHYPDGDNSLTVRVYTIRQIRPESGEVDIDIVRHAGGAFADWSETAQPGDAVGMLGPGGGYFPPEGWLAIGGDDTAVPAILRILENRPNQTGGHVVIGLHSHQAPFEIALPANFMIDWVSTADLVDAMKAIAAPATGNGTYWFAGEAEQARALRTHFKSTLELPAERRSSAAYWRRTEPA
ncbi:siderophore-interacting protein [Nisaea nitritireducens]|uniref:siderophore-interacting protein n=1 Tax=Nisaea nitritireducens TaxID=568392 RepID=UPI001865B034|nr:siderophore-interacting protein [Nisaea nitritireducens]